MSIVTETPELTRKAPTENQHIELVAQVDNVCPLCSKPLLSKDAGQRHKRFDVAHIYPLNPTPTERALLADEVKLSEDPNDLANLIPLCKSCHNEFDTPRTAAAYRRLVAYKQRVVQREHERSFWHRYPLERELSAVVEMLANHDEEPRATTNLNVKPVDTKTREAPPLTRSKIRSEVRSYFTFVQQLFHQMERARPRSSELVSQQVHSYYLAQQQICADKKELYYRVARWIQRKTDGSHEAAEILTSFFVQNCDVFE